MRSAGVKNYHHALLKELIPSFSPHRIRLFPFLKTLKPNQNERSNYPPLGTAVRLGGVLASNYSGLSLASVRHFANTVRKATDCGRDESRPY